MQGITLVNNLRLLAITKNPKTRHLAQAKDITITMGRVLMEKKMQVADKEIDSSLEITLAVESLQIQITTIITREVEVVIVVVDVIDSEINKAKDDQEATTIALAAKVTILATVNLAPTPTTEATTTTVTKIPTQHPRETQSEVELAIQTAAAINNQIILKLRPSHQGSTLQLEEEVTHKTIQIREEVLVRTPTLRDSKSSIKIKATILKATATNRRSQAAVACL